MFLFRANNLPIVFSVLKETLRLEFQNNLVINLVCLPTYVNLALLVFVLPALCSCSSFVRLTLFKIAVSYFLLLYSICFIVPATVAARSKAEVCGRSPAEFVGSNATGAWTFVCCGYCVLSGRSLCNNVITRPEESYRLWCVVVRDLETSCMRRPWPTGAAAPKTNICFIVSFHFLFSV